MSLDYANNFPDSILFFYSGYGRNCTTLMTSTKTINNKKAFHHFTCGRLCVNTKQETTHNKNCICHVCGFWHAPTNYVQTQISGRFVARSLAFCCYIYSDTQRKQK